MGLIQVYSGREVTAADTNDNTVTLITDLPDTGNSIVLVCIRPTVGTVKIGNGEDASSGYAYTFIAVAGDNPIYTFHSVQCPLHLKAGTIGDKFIVQVVTC